MHGEADWAIGPLAVSLKGAALGRPIIANHMRSPVLHVAPFLWSGAGGVITRLCEHQRKAGPVTLVTTGVSDGQRDWPAYRRRLARAGVAHRRLDLFHRAPDTLWPAVAGLAALVDEVRPAVIHAHAGVPTLASALARAAAGSRARLLGQMYSWGPERPAWMDAQDGLGFAQADRVICSARHYGEALRRLGVQARRLVYLPWGLPLDELPMRPRGPANAAGAPVLGFVGRIEPRKGQAALVEALVHLHRRWPEARLELVGPPGDDDYARAVTARTAALGLARHVHLHGHVRDPRVIVRGWDVAVSASSDEGQGLAVLEAMALGVPVAARSVAGISDFFVDGRTGVTIAGASPRAIALAVARVLGDRAAAQRRAQQARRLVERRYDWQRMLRAFDRLYWH